MNDDDRRSLVPRSPGSVAQTEGKALGVASRMTQGVLRVIQGEERSLSPARFRIGNYDFRAPDYQQILLWGNALGIRPERVVLILAEAKFPFSWEDRDSCLHSLSRSYDELIEFQVENGAITSMVIDLDLLPLDKLEWVPGLVLETVGFYHSYRKPSFEFVPLLPETVRQVVIGDLGIQKLSLANTPNLTHFVCWGNPLGELDLSRVPELVKLHVAECELETLDLAPVGKLTHLNCQGNRLRALKLMPVRELEFLNCRQNGIFKLSLRSVPKLREIHCGENRFTKLVFPYFRDLGVLLCDGGFWREGRLRELRIPELPNLVELNCEYNRLQELDLCGVPRLRILCCEDNEIAKLDLSSVPELVEFSGEKNRFEEISLSGLRRLQYVSILGNPLLVVDFKDLPEGAWYCIPKSTRINW